MCNCASDVFVIAVESLEQVKITDFGLAKVLEHDQQQVYGSGGKVLSHSVLDCLHNQPARNC